MAVKITLAEVAEMVTAIGLELEELEGRLNEQMAALETRLDAIEAQEPSGDKRKSRGRNMTDEQRAEAGRRLQQARADKLGLDTIEQLRALHLRPGAQPTKAQITKVKKDFPA